jgi:hypothetical protein
MPRSPFLTPECAVQRRASYEVWRLNSPTFVPQGFRARNPGIPLSYSLQYSRLYSKIAWAFGSSFSCGHRALIGRELTCSST